MIEIIYLWHPRHWHTFKWYTCIYVWFLGQCVLRHPSLSKSINKISKFCTLLKSFCVFIYMKMEMYSTNIKLLRCSSANWQTIFGIQIYINIYLYIFIIMGLAQKDFNQQFLRKSVCVSLNIYAYNSLEFENIWN